MAKAPLFLSLLLLLATSEVMCDEAPYLQPGGDLLNFQLRENTPPNSIIYTLKGYDPELGSEGLSYTISGDYFSINTRTGVISLRKAVDRESVGGVLRVVITLSDAGNNLIPFQREIEILDENDNAPVFSNEPYSFSVNETAPVGSLLYSSILVSDADTFDNAQISLECVPSDAADESCSLFSVFAEELEVGSSRGSIRLAQPLNYELKSNYKLNILARDAGSPRSLSSRTEVFVNLIDVQDQPPFFLNSPYLSTIPENTPPNTHIFDIQVRDGDTGQPQEIVLDILGDTQGFFVLEPLPGPSGSKRLASSALKTAPSAVIDREMPSILSQGGIYNFQVRAREILEDGAGSFGDESLTNVTVIIRDEDDSIPLFNKEEITVAVPENVGFDTPLPDLNLMVEDHDSAENAGFELALELPGPFSVHPTRAVGKTPVILRVAHPELLDYESPDKNGYEVKINALQDGAVLSSALIKVIVTDANDNAPIFEEEFYSFSVKEGAPPGTPIGSIRAQDADSGSFGQVEYRLKGFGADKFTVNPESGEIFVNSCMESSAGGDLWRESCLDYETQELYSLTYTGRDGGNEISTVTVNIQILDVNDNYPKFTERNYSRTVNEGSSVFEPRFFVKATDADGISQGGGKVFYSIHSLNTELTLFDIDAVTGELTLLSPVPLRNDRSLPSDGRFELVIRATDSGKPSALYSDAVVAVGIHAVTHLRPVFGESTYAASLPENATGGSVVLSLGAKSPEGGRITYKIFSGAKDNFVIGEESGEITVAEDADLDIQENGDNYDITILASNDVLPHPQTSKANVTISIIDVNDKSPKFDQMSYTTYVNEQISIGEVVLRVTASDEDRNSVLRYSIVSPVSAIDKAGNLLTNKATYDFTSVFRINPTDGSISLNNSLSYNSASVIVLTVQANDINAPPNTTQIANAEVTFYVQATKVDVPLFDPPWTPSRPSLTFSSPESQKPGSVLFKVHATRPGGAGAGEGGILYEKSELSDPLNLFSIDANSGEVFNNREFDYEDESMREISFTVLAKSQGDDKASEASIQVSLEDTNDNDPIFEEESYSAELNEAALPLSKVLDVKASDRDSGAFGELEYSLFGEGSESFSIDPKEGLITVQKGPHGRSLIDREKREEYRLVVLVRDSPGSGEGGRSASVEARIRILDSNDEAPLFSEASYSAVVPENSPVGTIVTQISAEDSDLGDSGRIRYAFVESSKIGRIFEIDEETGEIKTAGSLTGKGRKDPYIIYARAMDQGEPQLFTDVEVYITVGDVSENDGTPSFIRPEIGEIAYISEDASIGTSVFRAKATDPDDSSTSNGKIVFSLPNDGSVIRRLFSIHPVSGLLSTSDKLDREERSNYTIILEAKDLGTPSQHTSRTLLVVVQDVNDHAPRFISQINNAGPREVKIQEHTNIGSEILTLEAEDLDEGENAVIHYEIFEGNEGGFFEIFRTENNEGIVFISKDIDREERESFLLGIRCFHPGNRNATGAEDSESVIHVKVLISDIDDNKPVFISKNSTFGVRVNSAIYTEIATLEALDADPESPPITYSLLNITYLRPQTGLFEVIDKDMFIIDPESGTLHTNRTLGRYIDGQFVLYASASNGPGRSDVDRILIYVLQDTELMRFVFDQDPSVVRGRIGSLKSEIENVFINPLQFNIYDTEFYSKRDGSLDFGRTGSCFQVLNNEAVVDLSSSESLLRNNPELQTIYQKYDIIDVERCARIHSSAPSMEWPEILFVCVAVLVGVLSILASIILCCIYTWHKRVLLRNSPVKIIEARVRTFVHTSLPPGSTLNGGGGGVSSIMEPDYGDPHHHQHHHHQESSIFNDYHRPYENIKN